MASMTGVVSEGSCEVSSCNSAAFLAMRKFLSINAGEGVRLGQTNACSKPEYFITMMVFW